MKERIENIRKVVLNSRQVKLFDTRELRDGAWMYTGTFSAPVKTANKNLADHIKRI